MYDSLKLGTSSDCASGSACYDDPDKGTFLVDLTGTDFFIASGSSIIVHGWDAKMQAVFDDDTSSPVTGASPSGTDDYVTIPEGTQKISVACGGWGGGFLTDLYFELDPTLEPTSFPTISNAPSVLTTTALTTTQSTTSSLEISTECEDSDAASTGIQLTLEEIFGSARKTTKTRNSFSYSDFSFDISSSECDGSLCVVDFTVTAIVDCGGVCTDTMLETIESSFNTDIIDYLSTFISDGTFLDTFMELVETNGLDDLLDVDDIQFDISPNSPTAAPPSSACDCDCGRLAEYLYKLFYRKK